MDDWQCEMWADSIESFPEEDEDYDDMDDWQGGRPTIFLEFIK